MSTPAARLVITDRDGVIPIRVMRQYFEQAMQATDKFKEQPLEVEAGERFAYENAETNCLWNGFALGMRCAERIHRTVIADLPQ